jgi:hypothetical protein
MLSVEVPINANSSILHKKRKEKTSK